MYGIIYVITNKINGKQYVGQTRQAVERRWLWHVRDARRLNRNSAIGAAIRVYGQDNFKITAIDTAMCQVELDDKEMVAIARLDTTNYGYNLTHGGRGLIKPTVISKQRMAAHRKSDSDTNKRRIDASKAAKLKPGIKEKERTNFLAAMRRKNEKNRQLRQITNSTRDAARRFSETLFE